MSEDKMELNELEAIDTVVYLTDEEDGTEYVFECLDTVEYEDNEYAVMLPLDDADDGYVLVMQIEYNEEEAEFCVIVEESAKFVAEEYARGHSFFTYISDTADSLSSCCRLKNK
ncbi:MAG: DUF1292 domain-containing protein, partial [Anaerotignum sp.]|nr:DUF1292 domain-containing protein [Anaerotignum sp.]